MNISRREKLLTILNKKAIKHNEVPVSCIITKDDKIISKAYNNKITKHDPTAHAEIIAIRKAAKKLKTWNLNECRLYVTLYPCKMCLDVINEARIKEVYYILDNEKEINNNVKITKINSEKNEYFQEELKGFFKNKR
ncbi:cytosine/adenosine deaminases [Clostridium sp. CAG:524]|nr:nucleoside deaminase [Clostridium sp.]CDA59857.1 cytosine/adenosine deaminases [Clostridium sp. CAG:524]